MPLSLGLSLAFSRGHRLLLSSSLVSRLKLGNSGYGGDIPQARISKERPDQAGHFLQAAQRPDGLGLEVNGLALVADVIM
jgi:hypothetical protein